jgi:hypothetical protein
MKSPVPAALVIVVVLVAGCTIFHHKRATAPEPPPAVGIETEFRDRWVDRRVHELMTANPALPEAEARTAAAAEFAKQYPYLLTVHGQTKP